MRLLMVNGNTTEAITQLVAATARRHAPAAAIEAVTAPFGPRYIQSRAEAAIAAHAILVALARHAGGADAAIIACFGEPGLGAARELLPIPVVGLAEASAHAACQLGQRFLIVTGGARWVPMLTELMQAYGLGSRLAGVRALPLSGLEIGRDQAAAEAALATLVRDAAAETGADVVVLGGAGLAGMAERLQPGVGRPLVDCVAAAVGQAIALAGLRPPAPTPPKGSGFVDTDPALEALFQ